MAMDFNDVRPRLAAMNESILRSRLEQQDRRKVLNTVYSTVAVDPNWEIYKQELVKVCDQHQSLVNTLQEDILRGTSPEKYPVLMGEYRYRKGLVEGLQLSIDTIISTINKRSIDE